jgi:hypothetical protein
MTPLLSRYLQQFHMQKHYWLTRAEKRRAIRLAAFTLVLFAIAFFLWLRK